MKVLKEYRSSSILTLIFILCFGLAISFQNCSNRVAFDTTLDSDNILLDDRCTNKFTCFDGEIIPEEAVNKPEIKVVMVIDNSYTMSQMQEKLAAGVSRLIEGLKGFSASFSIYTTTHDVGSGSSPLGFEYEKSVLATKRSCRKVFNGNTTVTEECLPVESRPIGSRIFDSTRFELAPSLIDPLKFQIREDSGPQEVELVGRSLASEIKSVGIYGFPEERGVCSLVKSVFSENEDRPFKSKEDLGIFVVISDEDDESSPETCVSFEEDQIDCLEQDPATRTVTREVECRDPECAKHEFDYVVNLGSAQNNRRQFKFERLTYRRDVHWLIQAPQTFNHRLSYDFSITEDGVRVDFNESRNFNNSAESCSTSCSSSQLAAIINSLAGRGAQLVAGSCRVSSCTANPQPAPQPGFTRVNHRSSCGSNHPATTCESVLNNNQRANIVPGSCRIDENSCTMITEPQETGLTSVESCSPGACSVQQISGLPNNLVGAPWQLVQGSCQVSCSVQNLSATQFNRTFEQTADLNGEFANFCQQPIVGNAQGRNMVQLAEASSGGRVATSCQRSGPRISFRNNTVTEQVLANPGRPACRASGRTRFSYPVHKKVEDQPDLIKSFNDQARTLFGRNYFVSAIVHNKANNPNCPIQQGQSLGERYMRLVNESPSGGNIASICDPDYGQAAFDGVNKWVETTMKNTYLADFDSSNTEIISLWLFRDGVRMPLDSSKWQVQGRSVTILDPDLLRLGDRLIYRARSR